MKDTSGSVYGKPDLCPLSRRSIGNTIAEERNEVRSLSRPHLFRVCWPPFAAGRALFPISCHRQYWVQARTALGRLRLGGDHGHIAQAICPRAVLVRSCFPVFRAFAIVSFRTLQTTSNDDLFLGSFFFLSSCT